MNFFFGIKNNNLNSYLTIPKFQNRSNTNKRYELFEAKIYQNKWKFNKVKCKQNENFFFADQDIVDNETIFFLAEEDKIKKLKEEKINKLLKLNNFTDTFPAFRANLKIFNKAGGFSSYQSDYPFSMINKQGSIMSQLSNLTNIEADTNKVFIKNIFQLPIKEKFKVYFVDIQSKQILYEKEIITNMTNEVEIDKKFLKPNIFLFTKKYIGVPMYVSFKNYNISFEHTHPPHEYVLSDDRYKRVSDLKKEINEIIV